MGRIFEFDQQPVFMQNIQIDDIGNVALRCENSTGKEFYIVVKTYLGKTILLKFGPRFADLNLLTEGMELSFKKFDFKENIIEREINKYLNDGRYGINKCEIVQEMVALAALPTPETILNSL